MTRADELYEQYKSQKEGKSQRYYKTRADELYDKFSTSKTFKNRIEYVDSKEKQGVRVYDIATSSHKIERPVDEDYIKNYINDFNDYAESSQNDYGNVTYNNANSYNAQYSQTSNELKGRAEKIARYLKANRKQIDPKSYSELLPYIEQSVDVLDTTSKAFGDANKYYSQWDTEKDYNSYLKGIEERESLLIYDTDSAREKINSLDSQIASLDSSIKKLQGDYEYKYGKSNSEGSTNINTNDPASIVDSLLGNSGAPSGFDPYSNTPNNGNPYGNGAPATMNSVGIVAGSPKEADAMLKQISEQQKKRAQLESERNSINVTYNLATHVQTADQLYNDALNDENFNLYSDKGANNKLATKKAAYESGYVFGEATTLSLEQRFAKYATDEEMDIYSYYIGKGDEASAQAFLTSMEETINARKGLEIYEAVEDNIALEMAFGVAAGLNQFTTGVGNLFNDKDYYTPTATAMASASVREDLAEVGDKLPDWIGGSSSDENQRTSYAQVGYDFITTTANMLPSILTSAAVTYLSKGALGAEAAAFLGQSVGSFTLGASAAGNAYAEMINLGYDKGQAKTYAALVGGSEAGLNLLFGGVSKVGGRVTNNFIAKAINGIDSSLARGAIKFGLNMASEGLEEYAQEILDPFFRNLALGETNDLKLYTPEALYSGVLGALSAGLLEGAPSGVSSAANAARTYRTGKAIKNNTNFDATNLTNLVKNGSTISADSAAYKIANKVDKNTGAYTIGKLFNSIGAELSVQNKADIVKSLTRKSVAEKNANTIADWLGAVVSGAKLTKNQIAALEKNEVIADTFRDVIINQNSTVNQRMQGLYEAGGFDVSSGINVNAVNEAFTPDAVANRINESQMLETPFEASRDTQLMRLADTTVNGTSKNTPFIPTAKPEMDATKAKAIEDITAKHYKTSEAKGETVLETSNESVNIKKIASIKGNNMTLELDDGREVSSKDISYASEGEALVYETVANMDVPVDVANNLVSMYSPTSGQSAKVFAKGIEEAYRYGYYNIPKAEMLARTSFTAELTPTQRETAYKLGNIMGKDRVQSAPTTRTKRAKGRVIFDGDRKHLSSRQKTSLKGLEVLAKVTGLQIEVFESPTDEEGNHIGENGSYDPKSGTMRIDLYAGVDGNGVMLYTAAHELIHHIKVWSPAKFKILADFLVEQYGEKGVSVDELVRRQIAKAKANGRTIDYDTAYEEVIADSMESMLADGAVIEKLQRLAKKDQSIVQKIESYLKDLVAKIKEAYKGLKPDSAEGKFVADMLDTTERLQELFTEAIMDASVNYKNAKSELVNIDAASESASPKLSERTWTASAYVQHREVTAQMLAKTLGVTKKKALEYIDDVNSIARLIADDRVRLDYEASPFGSAFVSNSEYGGSFDFTTLCKKRRLYTGTFSEIQKRLGDVALTPDHILEIRNMLTEAGKEATCGLCYVEGSRANMGKFAKEFIRLYKRDNPDAWIPSMYDVNTPDGVESMKRMHPEAYEQYKFFWNHYGKLKADDKALFASQQKPKLYESRKEYKGEILEHFSKDTTVQAKNRNGGIRMQSFSDFELVHLIDTMQIIMDMASVGLSGQAYTKVPEFADAFGNTGLKINLSLIAKGVDENGKLIFDDREGMPHETAFGLRNKYSKNVGTIIVTFTDEQLYAAMADSRIDFIIPFHRSQWKKGQYQAMGLPQGTKDYTYMQNEKLIKQTYHEYRGKMVKDKASNYMPNEYWDFSKSGKENAEAYLEMCAKENKRPKFYKLLDYDGKGTYSLKKDGSTDGYWKLLIDFKMYDNDGVSSAQQPVTPNFSMDEAIEMLNEYKGGHQSYPVAYDVVDSFVDSYNKTGDDLKLSARDSSYMSAVESGDMETAQRLVDEAAREAGYSVRAMHSTNADFTVFDISKTSANNFHGKGIYFTSSLKDLENNYENYEGPDPWQKIEDRAYELLDEKHGLSYDDTLTGDAEIIDLLNECYDEAIAEFNDSQRRITAYLKFDNPFVFEKGDDINASVDRTVYDGIVDKQVYENIGHSGMDENTVHYIVFNPNNIKSSAPVTYDDNGNVIPLSKRFDSNKSDIRYSDRDPDAITTRGLLADALESTAANDIERKKLEQYKKKIDSMNAEEKKLSEIRKEIKELSFGKGKRDTERLKKLNAEATMAANRIATYDKQLLNLESTQAIKNVLEREKKKAVERQKVRDKEALKAYKEQVEQRQQKIIENYRESRQSATESRHRTEMRNKIKKVVNELNQYLKGTKEKHVSEGMQTAVAEALSVINMDTVDADARVAEYNARIEKATDPIVIEALTATRDRIQAQGDNLKNKLEALQLGYAKIKQSSDPSIASAYNKGIEDKIASVVDVVGNTPLRNMSMNQLEEVYDLYKLVLTSIRDRNKMFVTAQKETVQELGIEAKTELSEVSKKIEYINSVNKLLRKIGYKDLKPIYFFRMLGSKTMTKLYKAVSNGQGTWYKDMREAKSFRIKAEKEYNYKNWDMKKTYSFTSNSGSSFKLTLQQIMSIYAYYRRDEEKAIRHLVDGGFVFDKSISVIKKEKGVPVKYYVNTAEAFNLSEAIINNIISTLSDEQRAYVEKMQAYLSDTMGAKGNEVSLKLYDVKLFKEKNYFPIKSSSTYMDYNPEEPGEVKIKNSGFTKATNQFANNPIVLDDFLNIWTSHVNDMSMYHAFVLPLEDFTRVYNYRNITDRRGAIQATIETNYTEAANSYIKQLLKDINGGSVSGVGTEVIDKMVGLAKKGAVFASASVVVQQPSAIARAMAYVNPKYFVNVSSFNLKRHNQLWEECKQYAPVAGIKEMGYFDTSVGRTGIDWLKADEYDSVREKFFALFKDKEQRRNIFDDALSFAPAMADELSWVALWEAVKKETRKTTNLEVGSEEFFKHCGERFTEVVDLTQVYDSVFARSELMRSKDRSVKMATSFMAEPTTQVNMLFDAVLQLKRGKKSALAPAAATIGAVVGSVVLNSILKSFVLAGRDDDEDETYFEKYVVSFTGDVLNGMNPLTLIPLVKDVISIIQGYSVDRMDMSVLDALITSIMDFGNENKSDSDKLWGFIGAAAQLFGVPAKNIIRDVKTVFNTYNTVTNGNTITRTGLTSALKEGLSGTVTGTIASKFGSDALDTSKGKQYYDAVMDGDTAHANRIVASYDDKKKADNAIVDALEKFEPRITEAAQAHIDGSTTERVRISKEIIADGFAQDCVVKAVNRMISKLEKGEGESESSGKPKSLYTKEDYFNAAYDGNTSEANTYKEELIKFDMDTNDKTREEAESSLNSSFKSAVRKAVIEDGLTMEKATRMLADYGGVTEEKAYELAQGYDFVAQHPDLNYDWKAETVAKYLDKAEPAGISVSVYDDYLVKKSQCKGVDRNNDGKAEKGTKKAQIYKMIDSLPITSHQKAVLKLMNK